MTTGWAGPCWVLVLLSMAACASRNAVGVGALVAEGRANELQATADYRGQNLRVSGVVTRTGIKHVERLVGEGTPTFYGATVTVSRSQVGYPYLYLVDARTSPNAGQLLCFFLPDALGDVAHVRAGESVTVRGDFQQYSEGGATIVLQDCQLEQ
jgi:hypothetical protein